MFIIIYFYLVLFVSELLSLFGYFTPMAIRIFHISIILCLALVFRNQKLVCKQFISSFSVQKINSYQIILLFFSIVSLFNGFIIAPNNWDSLTYHFSRFLHWFSNQDLNYFYTSNSRENIIPILPDLLFAQMFAIFSGDKALFLIIWLAVLITSYYVYRITLLLSESKRASYIASVLSMTLPSHVAFMSSTQTDPITTLLIVILFYYAILLNSHKSNLIFYLIIMTVPLLITSKTTGVILSIPIFLYIIFTHQKFIVKNYFKYIVLLIVLTVPAFPSLYRLFGSGSIWHVSGLFVREASFSGALTNGIGIFISGLQTPVPFANEALLKFYTSISSSLETYGPWSYNLTSSLHGDLTGNPLHVLLITISFLGILRTKKYQVIIILIFVQFLLFSNLIAWQPWINRFSTTIVVLGSILVGIWISMRSKILEKTLITILVFYSSFWLFFNPSRVILDPIRILEVGKVVGMTERNLNKVRNDVEYSRERQYFSLNPEIEESYINSMEKVKESGIKKLYVKLGSDDFEYPIWALTNFKIDIQHFKEQNLQEIYLGRALFFCTKDCGNYTLEQIYKDKNLTLFKNLDPS
jgi:hypothetical protein